MDQLILENNSLRSCLINREEQAAKITKEILGNSLPHDIEVIKLLEEITKVTLDSIDIEQQIKDARQYITPDFKKKMDQETANFLTFIKETKESISKTEKDIKSVERALYQRFLSPQWQEFLNQSMEWQISFRYPEQLNLNLKCKTGHRSHNSDLKQKSIKPISPLSKQQHSLRGMHSQSHLKQSTHHKPIITQEMRSQAKKNKIDLNTIESLGEQYVAILNEASFHSTKRILSQTQKKVRLSVMLDDIQLLDIAAKRNNQPGVDMSSLRHTHLPEGSLPPFSRPRSSSGNRRRDDDDNDDLVIPHSARTTYKLLSPLRGYIRK